MDQETTYKYPSICGILEKADLYWLKGDGWFPGASGGVRGLTAVHNLGVMEMLYILIVVKITFLKNELNTQNG